MEDYSGRYVTETRADLMQYRPLLESSSFHNSKKRANFTDETRTLIAGSEDAAIDAAIDQSIQQSKAVVPHGGLVATGS